MWSYLKMIKFIIGASVVVVGMLFLAFPPKAYSQQITIYTGANGQYLGQAVVLSPTQPPPPAWNTNGQ
jgi:hypothetical protein